MAARAAVAAELDEEEEDEVWKGGYEDVERCSKWRRWCSLGTNES